MRTSIGLRAVLIISLVAGLAAAELTETQDGTVRRDPLDKLLAEFAAASEALDIEKAERLFLPPDETPAGVHRQALLAEMRKDWGRARESDAERGPVVRFEDTQKIIRTQMTVESPGETGRTQARPMEFTVRFTDEGWKIVSMRPLRAR